MRFCIIKIIFLFNIALYCSQAIYAKEYDFSFDLQKPKTHQEKSKNHSVSSLSLNSWRLGMQASLLPSLLKSTGELIYGDSGKRSNTNHSNWNKYLLALGASGKWNSLGYGFNFYSVGQQYKGVFNSKYRQKKGRAGYDSWLSLNIEKLQIKAKYLESWTNVSNNTNPTQSFDKLYEIETSYPLSSTPLTEISITYGLGERRRFTTPTSIQTYQGSINSFKAKFRFVNNHFKFFTEIKQSNSKNNIGNQDNFQQKEFYFNSTVFPQQPFSIISSYRYSIDSHSGTTRNSKLNKMDSSLWLVYKPKVTPFNLKLTSRYKNYRSDNNLIYKDQIKLGAQLNWKSKGTHTGLKSDWTLKFGYNKDIDHINPTASFSDLRFNLQWQCSLL